VRHWKKALFGLIVTILLLWWALGDVSFGEVWNQIRAGDLWLLAASVTVATLGFYIRALRWDVLLRPVDPNTRTGSRFAAVSIGFMANNLLPARVGEFARAYAFSRMERVTASAAFGTLVVERLLDGIVLLAFLVLPLLTPGFPATGALEGGWGGTILRAAVVAVVGISTIVFVMAVWPRRFVAVATSIAARFPGDAARRVVASLEAFLESLAILRNPRLLALALGWSLLFWTWHGISFWLGMLAFDIDTGFISALFTEAVVGFGVAIPSAPGFFGTFHAAALFAASSVYGVDEARALAFAFGYHFGGWLPITVIGLWYSWKLGLSLGDVGAAEERVERAIEAEHPDGPAVLGDAG